MSSAAWARRGGWVARVVATALLAVALLAACPASAVTRFMPPPLRGHVMDITGTLADDDVLQLDAKLEGFRQQTGFAIVALVVGPLQGEPIEDVAYDAFNQWQVGDKGKDNGVLLVVAPSDRRVRIETGKGVGGELTDLESNDIIHNVMGPLLAQGRLRDALDQGSQAVARALAPGTAGGGPGTPVARRVTSLQLAFGAGLFVLVVVLLIVSPGFRSFFFFLLQMMLFRGGGGGGGGGGAGGSGYSGGGGRSGGGGSSDNY